MYRHIIIFSLLWVMVSVKSVAQTLFVDPVKGKDYSTGTIDAPLASLGKAVALANEFKGTQPVTIKLAPDLYLLTDQLVLKPFKATQSTASYTIEALVMPDDTRWLPSMMPVIQSVSPSNKKLG